MDVDILTELLGGLPDFVKEIKSKLDEAEPAISEIIKEYFLEKYIPLIAESDKRLLTELMNRGFSREESMSLMLDNKIKTERWLSRIQSK